ncbi:hypothetical protein BDN71DRAFT_1455307 [Pleurotus eryngii]|uniref:Uncharacterized protein n=1 Tax=Pleurotus eryngii TaxID=5323 RepID=A0A9P5ZM28_PLEER|nr:hypothetical protein BDN71DRAFT_1455307 [Pleurotus eryngii]
MTTCRIVKEARERIEWAQIYSGATRRESDLLNFVANSLDPTLTADTVDTYALVDFSQQG